MEDIISKIIKIDQEAQEKINELNIGKEQHKQKFEAKMQQTIAHLEKKVDERVNAFEKTEQEFIENQKLELNKEMENKIKKLDEKYEFNHDEIERKIFKNIIKNSV